MADAERRPGCEYADKDRAKPAGTGVEWPCTCGDADEQREGDDSKREEQPAQDADGGDAKENAGQRGAEYLSGRDLRRCATCRPISFAGHAMHSDKSDTYTRMRPVTGWYYT